MKIKDKEMFDQANVFGQGMKIPPMPGISLVNPT